MELHKFISVTVALLNPLPKKETVVLKGFIKPQKITTKSINLEIEKGILANWSEVGEYLRFGIKQEKQLQCPVIN
jgi:hypothetical protein